MEDKVKEMRDIVSEEYKHGHSDDIIYRYSTDIGITEEIIQSISKKKSEPLWMLELRLKAYKKFLEFPMPKWGPDLSEIDFSELTYYNDATGKKSHTWDEVPSKIKETFKAIGIPEAEQKWLAGVTAQYDSEAVYSNVDKELTDKGIIFTTTDDALRDHEDLFKEYFAKLVSIADNKFAALNAAVWSGGSFIYIPKNVELERPIQSYFRINAESSGQFERTLIIADEGSNATYIEGCTAPVYSKKSLHAAVVEIYVKKNAKFRYTTIQNWSNDVYNLVTKRSIVDEGGNMEWIDGNIGSAITMKYPAIILKGDNSKGMSISIAFAGKDQIQDVGAKMIHLGKNTNSNIISKSISRGGGKVNYRGEVIIKNKATNSRGHIECDTMIIDELSTSDTIPYNSILNGSSFIEHEAKVSKISEDQLFYLQSRGIPEEKAIEIIILGFLNPFTRELPMEYAVELNRLIQYEFDGTLG